MGLDIRQSESEHFHEPAQHGIINKSVAMLALSSNKRICSFVLILLIMGLIYLSNHLASPSLLVLIAGLIILAFVLGALATGLKFSSGLELAKLHLEEASETLKNENKKIQSGLNITGIPAIDNLYQLVETAATKPELELIRVKEELSLVLNNIAATVILYGEDGEIKFCSPYVQVLTGYSQEQLLEFSARDNHSLDKGDFLKGIIIDDDWQRYKRARLVSHLGEDSLVRFRIKHKSGLTLWLESRMVPIINPLGEVQSVMSITIDVTDSINYQKQIEQQNQDLNDFAYMVSHDLKAPIFTIHGMADALKDDYQQSLPLEAHELLTFITDAAKRLDKLVASVLEYSALSNTSETVAEVSLNDTIEQVRSDYSKQLQSISTIFTIPENLPVIKADPIRVYQVFSNLIGNAIKYRNTNRPLELEISYRLLPPHLVEIEIKDNGLGIPNSKLNEIFRPYRRAHGADIEGSGVGLACVKKIVEKLGGQVYARSTEGSGSSFYITLPLVKPARRIIPEDLERIF